MENTEKKQKKDVVPLSLPVDFFFSKNAKSALPPQCALLPDLPRKLEFQFTKDPNMALPLIALYDYWKKTGQIAESISYEEFQQAFPVNEYKEKGIRYGPIYPWLLPDHLE